MCQLEDNILSYRYFLRCVWHAFYGSYDEREESVMARTSIKYIKYEFVDCNTLHIIGWVRSDIGGEFNLDGFLVSYHKKKVREVINRMKVAIK